MFWVPLAALCLVLCDGQELEFRIVKGTEGTAEQFPWHTILADSTNNRPLCGATLLTASYAVTAAHCVAVNRVEKSAGGLKSYDNCHDDYIAITYRDCPLTNSGECPLGRKSLTTPLE